MRACAWLFAVVGLAFATAANSAENITYSYDAKGRLVGVARTGDVNNGVGSAYAYDAADNRTQVTVTGAGAGSSVSFAINDVTATEGGTLQFTVAKSGSTTNTLTVNFATANGTATAGSDYTAASGTLTFNPSDTSKTVSVATIDDTAVETSETVLVNLSAASGGSTISDTQGVGTITDNDVATTLAINDVTVVEGQTLNFTVTRSGGTGGSTTVNYATADLTATSGSDYGATSGTITFASGETSKTISISTVQDALVEADETFAVNLSGSTGGSITDAQGIGTIANDDVEDPGDDCPKPGCIPDPCPTCR